MSTEKNEIKTKCDLLSSATTEEIAGVDKSEKEHTNKQGASTELKSTLDPSKNLIHESGKVIKDESKSEIIPINSENYINKYKEEKQSCEKKEPGETDKMQASQQNLKMYSTERNNDDREPLNSGHGSETFILSEKREKQDHECSFIRLENKHDCDESIATLDSTAVRASADFLNDKSLLKVEEKEQNYDVNVNSTKNSSCTNTSLELLRNSHVAECDKRDCDGSVTTFDTSFDMRGLYSLYKQNAGVKKYDAPDEVKPNIPRDLSNSAVEHLNALGMNCDIVPSTGTSDVKRESNEKEIKINDETIDEEKVVSGGQEQKFLVDSLVPNSGRYHQEVLPEKIAGGRERVESWGGMSDISQVVGMGIVNGIPSAAASHHVTNSTIGPGDIISPNAPSNLFLSPNASMTGSGGSHSSLNNVGKQLHVKSSSSVPIKIAVPKESNPGLMHDKQDSTASFNHLEYIGSDTQRDRLDSLASLSESIILRRDRLDSLASISDLISRKDTMDSLSFLRNDSRRLSRGRLDSFASLGEVSVGVSVTDELADIAGNLEAALVGSNAASVNTDCESESVATMNNSCARTFKQESENSTSVKLPTPSIHVDSEAVQAAVEAALAATAGGVFDFLSPSSSSPSLGSCRTYNIPSYLPEIQSIEASTSLKLTPFPTSKPFTQEVSKNTRDTSVINLKQNSASTDPALNSSALNQMELIRARARAAAGYTHPGNLMKNKTSRAKKRSRPTASSPGNFTVQPVKDTSVPKKRTKNAAASSPAALQGLKPKSIALTPKKSPTKFSNTNNVSLVTPKIKNVSSKKKTPRSSSKGTPQYQTPKGGQSNQKWDEMLDELMKYKEEQREKQINSLSEEEKKEWVWDGNVPTMFKTKDGKALGRWINNQRSAKTKGNLKPERERRLLGTGLKWSVLTTNAWTDMMEELRIYVKEKTKEGKKWDGNVPTNYRIKGNTAEDGTEIDEDKNLGRWINRQRSLFQSGKLKKDRQKELDKIGLRWSVLSTTSWESMYEALCQYVQSRKNMNPNSIWDGNVPASHETSDKPPKRLGRWVNRQRSAYAANKLKNDFVLKLEKLGLKWTMHDTKKSGITEKVDVELLADEDDLPISESDDASFVSKPLAALKVVGKISNPDRLQGSIVIPNTGENEVVIVNTTTTYV
eukprot:CAMPEP_0184868146 /NCGR_PEP_ID=MMETSP0580-20130426/29324_1 /TAXON_ID=1118495 /ORGANISM="Dactyliosolen fragilissimus" /LENGTH=1157 /DNA_ID=CAMNT_0027368839 /DNA_START=724 /DNA_END=4197 /DNA_ORIENTATION=+